MTEERKQELRLLLQEAIANLEIQPYGGFDGLSITLDQYKRHLRQSMMSYSENSLWVMKNFTLDISENIKSKLLDFIREELNPFIHEDRILSPAFFILTDTAIHDFFSIVSESSNQGSHLNQFLDQLLKITVFRGIEESASDFARCTKDTYSSFQTVTLLGGLTLEGEVEVFKGIRLVPIPSSRSKLPPYCRSLPNASQGDFRDKTLLVIDYSVFPTFHNPFLPATITDRWVRHKEQKTKFQIKGQGEEYPDFDRLDFHTEFCRALSLVCNSTVQIFGVWNYIAEDELFKMNYRVNTVLFEKTSGNYVEAKDTQIGKAKCLYHQLVDPDLKLTKKLQIPIDRWIKSKTYQSPEDQIIDLVIALESLYLSGIDSKTELRFRFSLHAAWHLGKNKAHRKELMKEFKAIYDWRSRVVHTGKLPNKTKKTPFTRQEITEFIKKAQDLCRDSILKILNEGKFPDWDSLILDEESS